MDAWQWTVHWIEDADGVRVALAGRDVALWLGPFRDRAAAERALHARLVAWRRRATALGGWLWRPDGRTVAVALPAGVIPRGAAPLRREAVSAAGASAPVPRR
jgi:hypothetical protein